MGVRSRLLVSVVILIATVMPAAMAQPPYPVYDYCFAVEHVPSEPIDNAPSRMGFYASFGTYFGGGTFTFSYDGASGPQMGSGPIDASGIGHGYGPLFSFGDHAMTGGTITMDSMTYDLDVSGLSFTVDDDEPMCDDGLSVVDNTPEETTTTVPPTTPPTTAPTTMPPTTTPESTSVTTAAPPSTEPPPTATLGEPPATSIAIVDEGGTSYTAWWWTGGILLVIGGGLFFFARAEEEDCIPLKAAWLRAKKICDEANEELERRRQVLQEAKDALAEASAERQRWIDLVAEIEGELDQLRSARASSVTSGGTTFHRIPEGLVTAEGLESIISAVEARLANARDNVPDVTDSELQWQRRVGEQEQRVQEAADRAAESCEKAAAAKKAYEDCINASSGPDPQPSGEGDSAGTEGGSDTGTDAGGSSTATDGGGSGTEGGGSGGGGTVPPPTPPATAPDEPTQPGCTNGEKRNETIDEDQTFRVSKNTANLVVSVEPPTEDFADWMAGEMARAGGRFAPNKLGDPGFSSTVRDKLRDLDSDLAVSHSIRVEVPQQDIRYICVSWEECVNGAWVSRKERRESGRSDVANQVFERQGKMSTRDVTQLLAQAKGYYDRLIRNDEQIEGFCQ